MWSVTKERLAAAVAVLLAATATVVFVSRSSEDGTIERATPAATPTAEPGGRPAHLLAPDTVGAVTTTKATAVRSAPSAEAPTLSTLRAEVTMPALERRGGYVRVLTPCEATGWIAETDASLHPQAAGSPERLAQATIVLDPGHGGQLGGAVGPTGLPEKEPNLEIVRRLAARLPQARVVLTRDADYTAGLVFRATLANSLRAHLFVSVHNNAEPDGPSERPGTETYFQYRSPASRRLAGLLYEDVVRALTPFGADWVGDRDAGAKYRLNPEQADYYGLLRRSEVPTTLVEALFVSNPSEEALLRRPAALDAIADALASGLRRYFETDDAGSGFTEPYPREPGPSGRLPSVCNEPGP